MPADLIHDLHTSNPEVTVPVLVKHANCKDTSIQFMLVCRGKWAHADQKEVDELLAQGKPHCFRFRVLKDKVITIDDSIRGKVSWNTDSLGDFVVMRSNGLPVYNFCVAVDDATMKISHVIRAEEHLPNTLRQVGAVLGHSCGADHSHSQAGCCTTSFAFCADLLERTQQHLHVLL